jgi:hypothetical protein
MMEKITTTTGNKHGSETVRRESGSEFGWRENQDGPIDRLGRLDGGNSSQLIYRHGTNISGSDR